MDAESKPGTDEAVGDAPTLASTEGPARRSERPPVGPGSRYVPGATLGRGGMGEVVSARDAKIGRSVAIKRMRVADASPDLVARFMREARIQGGLEHPAIVPVHDVGEDEHGQPYFIMKQLAGVALSDIVDRLAAGDPPSMKRYPRQRLLRAFAEICLAVEFAHRRGIVHRDLKPANIMLGEFGEVYVLDWGIARLTDEADLGGGSVGEVDAVDTDPTAVGTVLGTPGYMSPEQIRGDADLDGRADVYALGCILFELLAFSPLHPRGPAGLAAALDEASVAPSSRARDRDIPPELDAICVTATRGDRAARYATARALGEAVQGFLDGDRDVALRKDLALAELDAARAALARGKSPADRRLAIRAAARAVALDPTQHDSVELVGRLMLEPPDQIPQEVDDAVRDLDLAGFDETRPLLVAAGSMYLGFAPILWWCGFREPWFFACTGVLTAGIMIFARVAARDRFVLTGRLILVACLGLVVIFGVVTTPLLVAPGLATVVAMTAAAHPRLFSRTRLIVAVSASLLAPWLLVALGVLPQTVSVTGNTLVLQIRADALDRDGVYVALVAFMLESVVIAVLLAHRLAVGRRAAQRVVQLHAWQLRQLVPRPATDDATAA